VGFVTLPTVFLIFDASIFFILNLSILCKAVLKSIVLIVYRVSSKTSMQI